MEKVSGKKKIFIIIISFIAAVIFAVSFFASKGIYLNSAKSVMTYDEAVQYSAIWESFRYIFSGEASIFYNLSQGFGGNFLGLIFYYLGSPVNLIISLFPIDQMNNVIYVLTVLKFGFLAASFSFYMLYGRKWELPALTYVFLSFSYAFMSFNVMYYISLMWLDAVIMLPLVLYGIEKIFDEGANRYFVIFLTLTLYVNYYMAYIIIIFSFIYFMYRWVSIPHENKFIKYFGKYVAGGVCSAFLAAPCLLVSLCAVLEGKGKEEPVKVWKLNYTDLSVFKGFLSCKYDSITNDGTPSIFVGTAVLILALLYFYVFRGLKKKCFYAISTIVFYLLCFYLRPLDMFWHMFRLPACFPGRYSFTFSTFIIIMAAETLNEICLYYDGNKKIYLYLKKYALPMGICFSLAELWLNSSYIVGELQMECRTYYTADYIEVNRTVEETLGTVKETDNSFYRIVYSEEAEKNDPLMYNYYGLSSFSSIYNKNISDFMQAMGVSVNSNDIFSSDGVTPFLGDLLSYKYYFSDKEDMPYGFEPMDKDLNTVTGYRNEDAFSGCLLLEDAKSIDTGSENVFENLNSLSCSLTGIDNMFVENRLFVEDLKESTFTNSKEVNITVTGDGPLYVYHTAPEGYKDLLKEIKEQSLAEHFDSSAYYYLDNSLISKNDNPSYTYIVYLGEYEMGDTVSLKVETNVPLGEFYCSSMNVEKYRETVDLCNKNLVDENAGTKHIYEASFASDNGGSVVTAIPYLQGMKLYLDGVKTDIDLYADTFVAFDVDTGEHSFYMVYYPRGLFLGLGILCLAIFCLIILQHKRNITWQNLKNDKV